MRSFTNVLINTICHIIIDGKAKESFYILTHFIMLMQTIACIIDQDSTLYLIVKWFDPSTFLAPAFSIVVGFCIILIFLILIMVKIMITEGDDMLVKPNTFKIYMGNLLLHIQMFCKTTLLSPLIRSSLLQIQNPSDNIIKILGFIALLIYVLFLLPVSLYNTSNTFTLTPQINKKLNYINIYLILNIFRVIFAVVSAFNQTNNAITGIIFFLIFMGMSIKQPVFAYSHERIIKGMISVIAFVCLCQVFELIMGISAPSLLIQIVGMISFIAFMDWLSHFRISKILNIEKPTIHQIKILIFLISNMGEQIDKLEYFIVKHHKTCTVLSCLCGKVIAHLSLIQDKSANQKLWYEFLIEYVGHEYCLEEIEKLPESLMKQKIQKYHYIVIDMAEIHLFKLNQLNTAYYIVNKFRHQLQSKGLSFLSFRQKKKIINYYMQEEISHKYNTEGATNRYADTYMRFQIESQKYRKMLFRSTNKIEQLWQEMAKREPDTLKLHKYIKLIQQWHKRILLLYQYIEVSFEKSSDILQKITNDYFHLVLNIPDKSPFHVIAPPKFQLPSMDNKKAKEKISENMQAFSLSSQSPMCFVSVDENSFGQITSCNHFFNQIMSIEFGKKTNIEEFLIPEMREAHNRMMKLFISGDRFSNEHKNGFTINTKGKIVYTKILVQIMPSIIDGLRYVFFLKKLMPRKKILGIKGNLGIAYSSQSFDDAFSISSQDSSVFNCLTEQVLNELKEKKQIKIVINEIRYYLRFMHQFMFNDVSYLFMEFYKEEDLQLQTKYNILGERIENRNKPKQNSRFRLNSIDYSRSTFINQDYDQFLDQKIETALARGDLQQLVNEDKQKKLEENIRNIYSLIVDDKKKHYKFKVLLYLFIMESLFGCAMIATAYLKQNNRDTYLHAGQINRKYSDFMLTVAKSATLLKLTTINGYQNKTSSASYNFNDMKSLPDISQAMDSLVSNFNIDLITQYWQYFSCNANNGTFSVDSENNFLTIADYVQNPFTNLLMSSIKNLSFPIAMEYIPLPFSASQCQSSVLIANSLYISIPGFLQLKRSVMNPLIYESIDTKLYSLIIFGIQLLIVFGFILGLFYFNKKVDYLMDYSFNLFQSMSQDIIKEKKQLCHQFLVRYTHLQAQNQNVEKSQAFIDHQNDSYHLEGIQMNGLITPNITDKLYESQNQREQDDSSNIKQNRDHFNTKDLVMDSRIKTKQEQTFFKIPLKNMKSGGSSKLESIFQRTSFIWSLVKNVTPTLPFAVFVLIFGSLQIIQVNKVGNFLSIQQEVQTIQLDINLIRLYALQYGVYDPRLQSYQSIPSFLTNLINEMYEIERIFVGKSNDLTYLPTMQQFIDQIGYGNICDMLAKGVFQSQNFSNSSYHQKQCLAIANHILTKGLYSSIIDYVESVHTLMLANPNSFSTNLTEKLKFLNSDFFIDESNLVDFFDCIMETILSLFDQDFNNDIVSNTNYLIYTVVGLIIGLVIIFVPLGWFYMRCFQCTMNEICSIFLLISYESIIKHDDIKTHFVEQMENFKVLQ